MWLTSAADLPQPMFDIAITQNPVNLNEILSFGSSLNDKGFIYDIKTNKYKQFDFKYNFRKYCDTQLRFTDVYPIIPSCVDTNDSNIAIVGTFGFWFQFFCVFDTVNNRLKPIINKTNNNKNKYYCLSTNCGLDTFEERNYKIILQENVCNYPELSFHTFSSQSILFKNEWLFMSGGGGGGETTNKHTLTLFHIDNKNNNYSPNLVLKIDLKKKYSDHGMILYKHSNDNGNIKGNINTNANTNTNKNKSKEKKINGYNKIDIVLFGGYYATFVKSFIKITFEFNQDYSEIMYDNQDNVKYQVVDGPHEWINSDIVHDDGNCKDDNVNSINSSEMEKSGDYYLNEKNWPYINNTCLESFTCQFLFNRYLLIAGGSHTKMVNNHGGYVIEQPVNSLKCFDLITKKWKVFPFVYQNDGGKNVNQAKNVQLYHPSGKSIFMDNIDSKLIYVMGGRRDNYDMTCNYYISINYFEWKYERLIWIAFEKNRKNKNCLLPQLPKDVIKIILTFLKTTSLNQLVKFI